MCTDCFIPSCYFNDHYNRRIVISDICFMPGAREFSAVHDTEVYYLCMEVCVLPT